MTCGPAPCWPTASPTPAATATHRSFGPTTTAPIDIYLGPEPPAGFEGNWIRTLPGTGWFPLLRLYGPTETWFDQSWKPSDLEPIDT